MIKYLWCVIMLILIRGGVARTSYARKAGVYANMENNVFAQL